MKNVLISIRPKWCELIASGKKTVEIRKTMPKLETPFKCYIYCTLSGSDELFRYVLNGDVEEWNRGKWGERKGNVIGEFTCDFIEYLNNLFVGEPDYHMPEYGNACLELKDLENYGKGKRLYGWYISDLVIYDKPVYLGDFKVRVSNNIWSFTKKLERPPQSWCYVEELSL